AGSVLGVNAFNQPDVEASKVATRRLTDEYEKTGKLPPESPLRVSDRTLAAALGAHFRTIKPGDYVALLAYVEMTAAHEATLQAIRRAVGRRSSDRVTGGESVILVVRAERRPRRLGEARREASL